MSQNRSLRVGPVALTTSLTTNILNPAAAGVGTGYTPTASYIILTHIRVLNKTASIAKASTWIGATGANAAGTEFAFNSTPVPPNGSAQNYVDWYGRVRLDSTDFLVGGADTTLALTLTAEGEVGLA